MVFTKAARDLCQVLYSSVSRRTAALSSPGTLYRRTRPCSLRVTTHVSCSFPSRHRQEDFPHRRRKRYNEPGHIGSAPCINLSRRSALPHRRHNCRRSRESFVFISVSIIAQTDTDCNTKKRHTSTKSWNHPGARPNAPPAASRAPPSPLSESQISDSLQVLKSMLLWTNPSGGALIEQP